MIQKTFKLRGNRALRFAAVFMAVIMALSCWVFTAPVASADSYISVSTTTPNISTEHGTFIYDNDYVSESDYAQIYSNLLYGEKNVSSPKAGHNGILVNGDTGYQADKSIYYPTVVMLYDGITMPTFGVMFGMHGTEKPWNWNYNNMRAFDVSFSSGNNHLVFDSYYWHGSDSRLNNQWNWLAHRNDNQPWCTSSGPNTNQNWNGMNDKYLSNIIKYDYSGDIEQSYLTITPNFAFTTGWDKKNGTQYSTYTSSVYLLNYKKVLNKLNEINSFLNTFIKEDWTVNSVNSFYTAINSLAAFNPDRYHYDYSSNPASAVQSAANEMDRLIAAVDTAKANLKHAVTFIYANGTNTVVEVLHNVKAGSPANTAAYEEKVSSELHKWHSFEWADYSAAQKNMTVNEIESINTLTWNFSNYIDPKYNEPGGEIYSCAKCGDTYTTPVPSLKSLINLDDYSYVDTTGTGSKFTLTRTKNSDINFEIVGLKASGGDHTLYKSAQTGVASSLKLDGVRITKSAGNELTYKFTKMDFTNLQSFYALVKVTGVDNYKYGENEIWTWQKITVVPGKNVFFDDTVEAITYTNSANADSVYGVWTRVKDNGIVTEATDQITGDVLTTKNSVEDSVTYSFGDAHKVRVSDTLGKNNWPKAQFTFTGSGFDLISLTDSDSGVFVVQVYKGGPENVGDEDKRVKYSMIDNYYGYTYTQLFYNTATRKIVGTDSDGDGTVVLPLYVADVSSFSTANPITPDLNLIPNGAYSAYYTTDPNHGNVVKEGNVPKLAYGWLQSEKSDKRYQVPCISVDLGAENVGIYTAVVEARFTTSFGHYKEDNEGNKYYDLIIDGVRIYNPADGNSDALAQYAVTGETYANYEIISRHLNTTAADNNCIIIDGMTALKPSEVAEYGKGAPTNELYVLKNGTVAFNVNYSGFTDARLGLKAADGHPCSVTIGNGTSSTIELKINSATEQYVSLQTLLTAGATTTITVTNNGNGILALTRLMTTHDDSGNPSGNVISSDADTAKVAMRMVRMLNADLTIDEDSVTAEPADDGTVTLTLKTSEDAATVVVRDGEGNVIDPESIDFTVDETGVKTWVVTLTESESDVYTYSLQAQYENGYAPEEPVEVSVTVTVAEPETGGEGETEPGAENGIETFLKKLTGFFSRLIEFIKKIIAIVKNL